MEQSRAHGEMQCALHGQHHVGTQGLRRDVDDRQQPETEREAQHDIGVALRHHLIHGKLHIERRGDDKQFQQGGQNHDLAECRRQSVQVRPEDPER